jgi:hypothetical protein
MVDPNAARRVISEQKLKSLLKEDRSAKSDVDEIVGGIREKIAYAKEHNHLNTEVYGTIKKLDRKESEKLALWWDDFQHYMEISGLMKRIESVQKLALTQPDETEGETETETETEAETETETSGKRGSGRKAGGGKGKGKGADNVRAFPQPHGMAAE